MQYPQLQEGERLGEEPQRIGAVLVEGAESVDCLGDDLLVVEREVGDGVVDRPEPAEGNAVEAELVVQGAGDGVREALTLVQERAGQGPFTGGAAVDKHGTSTQL